MRRSETLTVKSWKREACDRRSEATLAGVALVPLQQSITKSVWSPSTDRYLVDV